MIFDPKEIVQRYTFRYDQFFSQLKEYETDPIMPKFDDRFFVDFPVLYKS